MSMTNPKPVRMWDMAAASTQDNFSHLLDDGWEPFGVCVNGHTTIVYFRRPAVPVTPEVGDDKSALAALEGREG